MIDYNKGHWKHRGDGPPTIPPPRKTGAGSLFVAANPIWFAGCGCKKGVVPVIDRWGSTAPTEAQITTVARTIHNKNKEVDLETIVGSLTSFVETLHDQD